MNMKKQEDEKRISQLAKTLLDTQLAENNEKADEMAKTMIEEEDKDIQKMIEKFNKEHGEDVFAHKMDEAMHIKKKAENEKNRGKEDIKEEALKIIADIKQNLKTSKEKGTIKLKNLDKNLKKLKKDIHELEGEEK